MSLRAIIIDDDEAGIETLKLLIEKFIEGLSVVAGCSNPTRAVKLIMDYSPDIVFLDIQMPEMDGFELLKQVPDRKFNLIFTTAHDKHALRALKLNAFDYLLKPIDYKELRMTVSRLLEYTKTLESYGDFDPEIINSAMPLQKNRLTITTKEGVESLDFSNIISLESVSNYTRINSKDRGALLTPKTLKEFEMQLCYKDLHFMRVHNSYAINLKNVRRYLKEEECIVMINDQKIPLAKSRRENFLRWMSP